MEDQGIVALYWQRSEAAITQSQEKYGRYCFSLAQNILQNREDSEECVSDTWLHAWNAMPPRRPERLRMFFAKLTRHLAFDRWRSRTAQKRGGGELPLVLEELAECVAAPGTAEEAVLAQDLERAVQTFLRALPAREGDVFLRRYFFTEPLGDIAARYGMSRNHVSVLLGRTRKQLRDHLIKEGLL